MKKLLLVLLATMMAACNGPTDVKLSEMNEPENTKKLLEALTPQERQALQAYVVKHTFKNDLDYKMTVKEALSAHKKEAEQDQQLRSAAENARNSIK